MTTWEEKMRGRAPAPLPPMQHVATLFRVQGKSGHPIRCAIYTVATGTELRLEFEHDDELLRSQLFIVHDDDAIAQFADEWRAALVAKGFEELG